MQQSSHLPRMTPLRLAAPPRLLIVVPAYNEAGSIAGLLRQLRRHSQAPVLVVSDASSDATADIVRESGAWLLDLPVQLGAWGATQAGLRFALEHGFDQVVTLDADGQHEPECLPDLLAAHEESGADIVIGTYPPRLSRARRIAWAWFRLLSGLRVEDLTSGFRLYGRRAIEALSSSRATLLDYQDVGVLLLARKRRLRFCETPVRMHERHDGRSRIFSSWLTVAGYMAQTTLLCIARIGRFPSPERRSFE